MDGVRARFVVREWARFVVREFKHGECMDDVLAPSSGYSTSRIVDYIVPKKRYRTFTGDITNAFLHVTEDEECYVDPPREWFAKRLSSPWH